MSRYLSFSEALKKGLGGAEPAVSSLVPLLACSDEDARTLYAAADRVRAEHVGPAVHLRGLLEFSNCCRMNCLYCGLRRDNRALERYRLSPEEIVGMAHRAEELGYRTIVLQSGEDLSYTAQVLADIIRAIKGETDLAITLCVGERDRDTYRLWKEAGADRYLLRIETSDRALFAALHPDGDFARRAECLRNLKELGYQLGTGIMVGLPGQTVESVARDIIWMYELGAEMIGVGPFIPHPATPLKDAEGGTVEATLRLVAVLRIVFPDDHLPATTAVGTLDPLGRERALQAGADVMMPNITPENFRADYEIYPNKICLTEDAGKCRGCVSLRLKSIGRTISKDHGHVIRRKAAP
jgi:biotin synthase